MDLKDKVHLCIHRSLSQSICRTYFSFHTSLLYNSLVTPRKEGAPRKDVALYLSPSPHFLLSALTITVYHHYSAVEEKTSQ